MNRARKYRIIAMVCFITSAAASVAAAPLLIINQETILAGTALYAAAVIGYGTGTALALYAEDLAAPPRGNAS